MGRENVREGRVRVGAWAGLKKRGCCRNRGERVHVLFYLLWDVFFKTSVTNKVINPNRHGSRFFGGTFLILILKGCPK